MRQYTLFVSCLQALCTCLAAPMPEVVLETLKTLVAYVRRSHSSSIRFQGFQGLSGRLAAYAQSWGSREEVHLPAGAIKDVMVSCRSACAPCRLARCLLVQLVHAVLNLAMKGLICLVYSLMHAMCRVWTCQHV